MPRSNKKDITTEEITTNDEIITDEITTADIPKISTKKERKPNPWIEHVKAVRAEKSSEGKTYKEVLSIAKASYKQ